MQPNQPGKEGTTPAGQFWTGTFAAGTYQGRNYWLYVPLSYRHGTPIPLLVMLHGCSQTPGDFAVGTEMNRYADQDHLLVLYPEQPRKANAGKCWNWFQPEHQARGSGEPAEIVALVEQVRAGYTVDTNRVYAAGISAGAAMAVILAATYPDVFAAIGVSAGVAYKASTNLPGSLLVMARGNADPRRQGQLAYAAMGRHRRVVPVIAFHGTSDTTVSPRNGEHVISQWFWTNRLVTNGASDDQAEPIPAVVTPDSVPGGRSFTEYVYHDQHGRTMLKKYLIDGMKHGWSGGAADGSFTDPLGPKASRLMLDFFLSHTLHPTPAPQRAAQPSAPAERQPEPPHASAQASQPSGPRWLRRLGQGARRLFTGKGKQ